MYDDFIRACPLYFLTSVKNNWIKLKVEVGMVVLKSTKQA